MRGGIGVELAAFKKQADDRLRQGEQQSRGEKVDENQVVDTLAQGGAELAEVLFHSQRRQRGQKKSGQRKAKNPLRQLHQADGIEELGDDGLVLPESQRLGEQDVDLKRRDADRAGIIFATTSRVVASCHGVTHR